MNPKINLLLSNLNDQLNFIDLEIDNEIERFEKAIDICIKAKEGLRVLIQKTNFKSHEGEIQFFKEIKPQFTSKLIYYNTIFKFEMKKPNGGNRILKKYYKNVFVKQRALFDNELNFYNYHLFINISNFFRFLNVYNLCYLIAEYDK